MVLDLENINSEEILKIYKTESSVPHEQEVDLYFRGNPNINIEKIMRINEKL